MNFKAINKAEEQAVAFLVRVHTLRDSVDKGYIEKPDLPLWGSPETAALRRTSMELTRALAEMRR